MIVNSCITIYHRGYDENTRINKWKRYNYGTDKNYTCWFFGGKGSSTNKGYDNANDVSIRIPYDVNKIDISKIKIGDIVVQGQLDKDIETQQDLSDYEIYNITAINDNKFGENPHVHISGK